MLNVVDQGLIDATGPLTIWLVEYDVNARLTNNGGTLRASNGGVLEVQRRLSSTSGGVFNGGGTVEVQTGSTVRINNRVTLDGRHTSVSGTGEFRGGPPNTDTAARSRT